MTEPEHRPTAAERHVHDESCAFGNPTCPLFAEEPPPRVPWWLRVRGWFS